MAGRCTRSKRVIVMGFPRDAISRRGVCQLSGRTALTVAELRSVFGIETHSVGLGDGITSVPPHQGDVPSPSLTRDDQRPLDADERSHVAEVAEAREDQYKGVR